MLRKKVIEVSSDISNTNFMNDMDGVIKDTINKQYLNKLISNYIIINLKIIRRGPIMCSKKSISKVDVSLDTDILLIPLYSILEGCVYIGEHEGNTVNYKFHWEPNGVKLPEPILIVVATNGMSADDIKKMTHLSVGDTIPLYIINSVGMYSKNTIGCVGLPNFDDKHSPVFKFTPEMIASGKFNTFSSKLSPDKTYMFNKKLLVEVKGNKSPIIDFLDQDQLFHYMSFLVDFYHFQYI